jgi:hypothetical protein
VRFCADFSPRPLAELSETQLPNRSPKLRIPLRRYCLGSRVSGSFRVLVDRRCIRDRGSSSSRATRRTLDVCHPSIKNDADRRLSSATPEVILARNDHGSDIQPGIPSRVHIVSVPLPVGRPNYASRQAQFFSGVDLGGLSKSVVYEASGRVWHQA